MATLGEDFKATLKKTLR